MTTSDLVDRLAANWQMEAEEIKKMVDAVVQNMCDQLAQGNDFSIPGLGFFHTVIREKKLIYDEVEKHHKLMPPKRLVEFETGTDKAEGNHE